MHNSPSATPGSFHPDWQAFLTRHGAVFDDQSVRHFGNPEAECLAAKHSDILVDLSHLALLQAEGPDAETFLQGQLTNDIRQVAENRAQFSAYCNAKGRMFAIFLIVRRGASYYLQLPAMLAETTLKRLRMFVLRAKVKLELASPELVRVGISGPRSESLLKTIFPDLPQNTYDCISVRNATAIRLPGLHPRFEIMAVVADMEVIWNQLRTAGALPAGNAAWGWLDIMAALPTVLPGTVEEFVPQMANLELVNGVSFTKGCYPGQEIVARMHYLGRLKQRMVPAHLAAGPSPQPGTPVFSPSFPDQSAGTIVNAEPSPDGGVDVLLIAQTISIKDGRLHIAAPDGPPLSLLTPPYALPLT